MLIEALRSQIKHLQFEVGEYQTIVKKQGIEVPNLEAQYLEKQKAQEQTQKVRQLAQASHGGADPQEVKDLKVKLSHRDREIREL